MLGKVRCSVSLYFLVITVFWSTRNQFTLNVYNPSGFTVSVCRTLHPDPYLSEVWPSPTLSVNCSFEEGHFSAPEGRTLNPQTIRPSEGSRTDHPKLVLALGHGHNTKGVEERGLPSKITWLLQRWGDCTRPTLKHLDIPRLLTWHSLLVRSGSGGGVLDILTHL